MNQDALAALAAQTLAICAAGSYLAPSGQQVSIATSLAAAIKGTALHAPGEPPTARLDRFATTELTVRNESTFAAIRRLSTPGRQVAALNFASARTPGGGFQRGTSAQEEALAYASGLYPCLISAPTYYARNREFGSPLYLDLAIFSPLVPFFRDDFHTLLEHPIFASVITAPAPNARAIAEREPASGRLAGPALRRRAQLILEIAAAHRVDRLVLGAWGCGVFGNDPHTVAGIFADLLKPGGPYAHDFERVVFAVLDRSAEKSSLRAFERAFG
jgi:uncharacterized protein (TIGR02452 family)